MVLELTKILLLLLLPIFGFLETTFGQEEIFQGPLRDEIQYNNQDFGSVFRVLRKQKNKSFRQFKFGQTLGDQVNYLHWENDIQLNSFDSPVSAFYNPIPELRSSSPRQFGVLKKYWQKKKNYRPFINHLK